MPSSEHDQVVELLKAFDVAGKVGTPIADQRQSYEAAGAAYPVDPSVAVTSAILDAPEGGIHAEWVDASGSGKGRGVADRSVLYLHGGGYCIGSCGTHRELASRLSAACGAAVLVPDYRLAPEHPFPAALDDAVSTYRHLVGAGAGPESIALGGDSAGGGLALALLLRLKGEGIALPSSAFLLSPWVDLTLSSTTIDSPVVEDPIASRAFLEEMVGHYLGTQDPRDPFASPLFGDLTGLPPLLVQVGTAEVLLDDARRIAARAREAAVEVTLHEYDGLIHVFQAFAALAPEAADALSEIGQHVSEHWGRADPMGGNG